MSPFPNINPIFLETMLLRLVPLFLTVAQGCVDTARQAALDLLASYNAATEEELSLATEIASFSLGALEALGNSFNPDLSLSAVLRLRGNANALHRSAYQCERRLDKLRNERLARETLPPPDQTATTRDTPTPARPQIPLSRQQRRAMERAMEKAQRSQVRQAQRPGNTVPPPPINQLLAA